MSHRPALGPTQLPIQRVPEAIFSEDKTPGREIGHLPRKKFRRQEIVGIYLHFSIRLHSVMLNYLSNATLPCSAEAVPGSRSNLCMGL
jgi:hypothetical protein